MYKIKYVTLECGCEASKGYVPKQSSCSFKRVDVKPDCGKDNHRKELKKL